MLELPVIEVAVQSSLMREFVWPFLASLAAVFVSLWGSYFIYRFGRSYQTRRERERSQAEAKAAHQRAWSAIAFEVAENISRLKWLVENALTPQLGLLKQKQFAVIPLNQYRLRTSAIDICFADGTIKYLGDLGFQVRLKNEREQCLDLNLMLEHTDSFFTSNQALNNFIPIMENLHKRLADTARKGRISLENLFADLNSDDLRLVGQERLDLDKIEQLTKEKSKALENKAKQAP